MELFHTIVLSIAVIVLILILTVVGIMLGNKKYDNSVFPPIKNSCPDYWSVDANDPNKCVMNDKNKGKNNVWKAIDKTPGYNNGGSSVDFSDPDWTKNGGTSLCNTKEWANTYDISWDGVSNFNGCK